MRPTVTTGDLALAAQPASKETFAPYGRVLSAGVSTYIGKRGTVLVALHERQPGPRRVTDLVRYPDAKRIVLAVGRTPMWVVVLAPSEEPGTTPAAFLVSGGTGLVIDAGVWHAGPVPLADTTVCEMLETVGAVDRFDRRALSHLVDAQAVRVLLPEDPGASVGTLDLAAPNAVLLDASLHGRVRLGCLLFEDMGSEASVDLEVELGQAVEGLRAMWGHASDLAEIPGIGVGRELFADVGLAGSRFVPGAERLVAQVLAGEPVAAEGVLARTLALIALRTRLPLAAYDGAALADQLLVRTGTPGEEYESQDGVRVTVEGRPVLCDTTGPFGSPIGDAARTAPGPQVRRVLVVLYLPSSAEDTEIEGWLDGVTKALLAHGGGRLAGRLVVG